MSEAITEPRLSTRLAFSLGGLEPRGDRELLHDRRTKFEAFLAKDPVPEFSIEWFLPNSRGGEGVPAAASRQIRDNFRCFIQEVAAIADQQQHAARTMFNILTKGNKSDDEVLVDVESYFGKIPKSTFDRARQLALELAKHKARKEGKAASGSPNETEQLFGGVELNFTVPRIEDDIFITAFCVNEVESSNDLVQHAAGASLVGVPSQSTIRDQPSSAYHIAEELLVLCQHHVQGSNFSMDAQHLAEESLKLLSESKGASEDALQGKLFELVGEEGFEFMFALMQDVVKFRSVTVEQIRQASSVTGTGSSLGTSSSSTTNAIYDEFHIPPELLVGEDGVPLTQSLESLSLNQRRKRERKEKERAAREAESLSSAMQDPSMSWLLEAGFTEEYLEQERMLGLHGGSANNSNMMANIDRWKEDLAAPGTLEFLEKRGLPTGAERKIGPGFEEVTIPAPKRLGKPEADELVDILSLEKWAQLAFPGTKRLNRIQSEVFDTAYNSSENMLVCAPTGAGKTNIAMLAFLQLVKQHISHGNVNKNDIKAVYIAPMKALAQEVVSKFSERLAPLGMTVKEFTGDMQLTRQEVADSQLLVTTPEKYDVVTRKGGDGSLGTLVSLIIIDEVHLLADDRGAVIETIVARTQRYIESSQRMVRIVGLSATLPNYQDVAVFLKVNQSSGMYFFGPEYRPVPLDQTLIGITEKQRVKRNDSMNRHAYEKMVTALERGKQLMIFVHSRKETSRTAEAMRDLSGKGGTSHLLENFNHEHYGVWKKAVDKSRSQEVQQLFYQGLGVHHAGMLRADRTLTEQMFESGVIKVLCCTATLAWGVNLPAHTVIIKGTELYDPERGGFVDVSILDILQIFGRAGRPQYDTTGHAILITPHKSLNQYLGLLGHQAPIESGFIKSLADHMNAEIVNGTITNIKEAASWLSYTFLFVRMGKNPVSYGMTFEEKFEDPQLDRKRIELVRDAAETLDRCMMVRYDRRSGNLAVTDLGRVASHYYIKHGTIEAFNAMLTAHLNDSEALHVLCSSAEFDQLKLRPEELPEVDQLKKDCAIAVKGPVEETAGKVNVLLQGYCNQSRINSFTLQSDTNYVAQNAGRISRALFEISLKRGWCTMASYFLNLSKCIDRRMNSNQTPLRQFYQDELPRDVVRRIEETKIDVNSMIDMTAQEVGQLCHSQKLGGKILSLVSILPHLDVYAVVQPITRGILRMSLTLTAAFKWSDRYHGMSEPFWIWVEDGENEVIYHSEAFLLMKKQKDDEHKLELTLPVREPLPPQYYVRVVSDRWVGCHSVIAVSFQHLILPEAMPPHTNLLDMHPVPRSALKNESFERLYKFSHFNPIQSQTFHSLYHTDKNVLVGAPTGSGKTILGELAMLRLVANRPGAKMVYVAPLKALARERLADWKRKLGEGLGLSVLELTGEVTPDLAVLKRADVLVVTPEKWDSISRGWAKRDYVQKVELMIIDEIHLLGVDRGPVLEVIVSRMRFIAAQTKTPIRFVGLSTALANPKDLADWLGIPPTGVFNFRPSVRPIPMSIHIQGFAGKHYCPRMATMNKPTYAAILEHSPTKPALVFVSSRRQTRLTALDLISYCASDDDSKRFLHMPEDEVAAIAQTLRDSALRDTIVFGIGIHHAGLDNHDRNAVEELFFASKIQVLVCTSTLAWGVNLPCHLVIVKGTEFYDGKIKRYVDYPVTDVLQMMGRAGRPQFDDTGVACIMVHEPKKNFYKKFLHEPFPVESSLQGHLHDHINAEISSASLLNIGDCIEWLTWTYFFRRLVMNPSYYQLDSTTPEGVQLYLSGLIDGVLKDLSEAGCVNIRDDFDLAPTALGKIASYYYLDYRSVAMFSRELAKWPAPAENASKDETLYADISTLTLLLCNAYEFAELPVRHNEELLNAELAEDLPWYTDNLDKECPHTKAYMLLQAHFFRVKLPITDYINDTKSVLDQAPRVLNAMIDIAADAGYLRICLALMVISKMIVQALDSRDSELRQLPHINSIDLVDRIHEVYNIDSLAHVIGKRREELGGMARALLPGAEKAQSEFLRRVQDLPVLEVTVRIRTVAVAVAAASASASGGDAVAQPAGDWSVFVGTSAGCRSPPTSASTASATASALPPSTASTSTGTSTGSGTKAGGGPFLVGPEVDCELEISVRLLHGNPDANVNSPLYHKPKTAGYWLVLGTAAEELLSVKKVSAPKRSSDTSYVTSTVKFLTPQSEGKELLEVQLVSDSLMGLDVVVDVPMIITFIAHSK